MTIDLNQCFDYVECDIPAGMTIAAWQHGHEHEHARGHEHRHQRPKAAHPARHHHRVHLRRRGH